MDKTMDSAVGLTSPRLVPTRNPVTPWQFGCKFALFFTVLFLVWEGARGSRFEGLLMHDLVLAPTANLINMMAPSEAVRVEAHRLVTSSSALRITRGCEGIEMLLLLTAGLLAFPATLKHRVRGFLIGLAIVYFLTIARIVLLHFALRYSPNAWDMLHGLVLPLSPVLLVALYFLRWSTAAAKETLPADSPHAA